MMQGRVSKLEEGSFFIHLDKGQECWFDALDEATVEIGDIVRGNLWSYGGQENFNETKGRSIRVFMEGHR